MPFAKTSMKVSRKVESAGGGNEYQEVGAVEYFVPTLDEFGIQAQLKKDDNGQDLFDDDGLPVYADDKADYLFAALTQYVKMNVRNKLVPQTVELKSGAVIPSTWEQFLAESTGRGEALKIVAEAKKAFAQYVNGLDKSAKVKATVISLFGNKNALSLQSEQIKTRFIQYVAEFGASLEDADLERYSRYLQTLEEACKAEEVELD